MSTSRPARTATPTSFAGARRSRSTRTARTISKRGSSSHRRRGDGGAGLRITATQGPARRWAKVLRPPALGLEFEILTWVPVDQLTEEEREEYQCMHKQKGNEPENELENNKAEARTSQEIHKMTQGLGVSVNQTIGTFIERGQIPTAAHKSQFTANKTEAAPTSNPQMNEGATVASNNRASIPSATNADSPEQGPPAKRRKLSKSDQPGQVTVDTGVPSLEEAAQRTKDAPPNTTETVEDKDEEHTALSN